jgi:hypothetical protein
MTYEGLRFLVGTVVSVLLCALIVSRQRRLQRRPGIETMQDADLKPAFRHTIRWAILAGVFFGIEVCCVIVSLTGFPLKIPRWIPPPAIFLPFMAGLYSVARASHPPMRVR